ncbi:PREDICTED: translation initiation factor IF-2-like [Rhinopithecus bieti]|uniref:translation initiation factor IF-2-like n=1 Tax=Rhinopithecus bieti TaxID=61621 RepID=UPI00083C7001|nr:PREDICTED: translation initiation factor IF-2-like [Rhinopithecus bieti]
MRAFFICFNVPNGFVSEVPHCSRDLELTGTASSFISVGTRRGARVREPPSGRKAPGCVCRGGERRRRGSRGARKLPALSQPAGPRARPRLCGESTPASRAPSPKGPYSKRVSFDSACRNHLHIFCTSLAVSLEPGSCGFGEGSGAGLPGGPQPGPEREEEAVRGAELWGWAWGRPWCGSPRPAPAHLRRDPPTGTGHAELPASAGPQAARGRSCAAGKGPPAPRNQVVLSFR